MAFEDELEASTKTFDQTTGVLLFTYIAGLREGAIFGEKGLDDRAPRTATVICSTDCDFGLLTKEDYDYVLKDINREKNEKIRSFFIKTVFKGEVTNAVASKVGSDFFKLKVRMKKGDTVFRQGRKEKYIYVVRQGEVVVEREETDHVQSDCELKKKQALKTSYVLSILGVGEVLGEELIFGDQTVDFSTKVFSDECQLLRVTKECLKAYCSIDPTLFNFIRNLYNFRLDQRQAVLSSMRGRTSYMRTLDEKVAQKAVQLSVRDKESFLREYKSKKSIFLREKMPYRVFKAVDLCEIQETLGAERISEADREEMMILEDKDYLLENDSFRAIEKQHHALQNHRRIAVTIRFNQIMKGSNVQSPKRRALSEQKQLISKGTRLENNTIDFFRKRVKGNDTELKSFRSLQEKPTLKIGRCSMHIGGKSLYTKSFRDVSKEPSQYQSIMRSQGVPFILESRENLLLSTLEHTISTPQLVDTEGDLRAVRRNPNARRLRMLVQQKQFKT